MPWTYIVECADGSYYVGSTTDLDRRIWEHNAGLGAVYTRRRRPVRLVWSAYSARIDQAYAFEKQVQNWSRAKRRALIEGRTEELSDLASRGWAARRSRNRLRPHEQVGPEPLVEEVAQRPSRDPASRRTDEPPTAESAIRHDDPWAPPGDDGDRQRPE